MCANTPGHMSKLCSFALPSHASLWHRVDTNRPWEEDSAKSESGPLKRKSGCPEDPELGLEGGVCDPAGHVPRVPKRWGQQDQPVLGPLGMEPKARALAALH